MLDGLRARQVLMGIGIYTFLVVLFPHVMTLTPPERKVFSQVTRFGTLLWYLLGIVLAWRITLTQAVGSRMRVVWLLMTWSAGVAVARHLFEIGFWMVMGRVDPRIHPAAGFRQVLTMLSLALLLASLIAMWMSLRSAGLGAHFGYFDYAASVAALALLPIVLKYTVNQGDASAIWPFARALQFATPVVLAVSFLVGIALVRISAEMGGGEFSKCLQALTAFLFLRLGGHLLMTLPWGDWAVFGHLLSDIVWTSLAGIFVLGLTHRWEMDRMLTEALAHCETGVVAESLQPVGGHR